MIETISNKTTYTALATATASPAVTTYTVITPVGPNGLIYRRDRVGRLPQTRLLQIKK